MIKPITITIRITDANRTSIIPALKNSKKKKQDKKEGAVSIIPRIIKAYSVLLNAKVYGEKKEQG
jgi:hypothetical protein